ncbi:SRPBCC family protein [Actinomarinicola tropica]|uniref:Cyclase n=1 Tax=Actinomarinicola tropica TaxID=2789776 RepID=A0A5Q2RNA8_9ACTN|nr:SRPBCC family protein [Actinomarinicola tropica]QGG95577.1 cyclase [Actinomarinicola tropica]
MSEQANERIVIHAPAQACYEVAADVERYPDWAKDVKDATVLERDDEGRPVQVAFRTAAMGRSTSYTLRYDYAAAPQRLSWYLVEGDLTQVLDGVYDFNPVEGDASSTEVVYHLEVDLVVPLPGFVKRRAEAKILRTALPELKARVEAVAS